MSLRGYLNAECLTDTDRGFIKINFSVYEVLHFVDLKSRYSSSSGQLKAPGHRSLAKEAGGLPLSLELKTLRVALPDKPYLFKTTFRIKKPPDSSYPDEPDSTLSPCYKDNSIILIKDTQYSFEIDSSHLEKSRRAKPSKQAENKALLKENLAESLILQSISPGKQSIGDEKSSPSHARSSPCEENLSPCNAKSSVSHAKSSISEGKSSPTCAKSSPSHAKSSPSHAKSSISCAKSSVSHGKSSPGHEKLSINHAERSISCAKSHPSHAKRSTGCAKSPVSGVKQTITDRKPAISLAKVCEHQAKYSISKELRSINKAVETITVRRKVINGRIINEQGETLQIS